MVGFYDNIKPAAERAASTSNALAPIQIIAPKPLSVPESGKPDEPNLGWNSKPGVELIKHS
jgi:hypothetical protein